MERDGKARKWKPLEYTDDSGFACGQNNKTGLKMTFETDEKVLRSFISVPLRFKGWGNLVHGGIISTMLDEAMGWAAVYLNKRFILTKSMTINFKKPVHINEELSVYSYILEKKSDRLVTMQADLLDSNGDVCAFGTGDFSLFTAEEFKSMQLVDPSHIFKTTLNFS